MAAYADAVAACLPAGARRRASGIRWAARSRCAWPSGGPSSCGGSCSPRRPGSPARPASRRSRSRSSGSSSRRGSSVARVDRIAAFAAAAAARLRRVRGLEPRAADRALGARAAARPDDAHRCARRRPRARRRRSAARPRPRPLPRARPLGRPRPAGAARGRLRVRPPPARAGARDRRLRAPADLASGPTCAPGLRSNSSANLCRSRGVAQPGSALRSGRRGPEFKSPHPDTTDARAWFGRRPSQVRRGARAIVGRAPRSRLRRRLHARPAGAEPRRRTGTGRSARATGSSSTRLATTTRAGRRFDDARAASRARARRGDLDPLHPADHRRHGRRAATPTPAPPR